ncbi:14-3-3 protein beta/alpha [Sciurus carolinensis]|uniref:14-3-3 protein beta/alpha n=1 Tax=Sciurus carolinensis TaxID=30640 RepID=A0AA41MUS7_SCICA|nr:14-3-3 protein beta/alpha [Sciurus carolinensis]
MDKNELIQKVKLSEQAGTVVMSVAVRAGMELGHQLSSHERNLLCCLQECSRCLQFFLACHLQHCQKQRHEKQQQMNKEDLEEIQAELQDICNDVLGLLDKCLIPNATQPESTVFLKIKGDYFRCFSKVTSGDDKQTPVMNSQQAY